MVSGCVSYFRELYSYRHMLAALVTRQIKGKYRHSIMGFSWNFLSPLIMITIYYFVFSGIIAKSIDDYWIYISVGIFPYRFFDKCMESGAVSITSNKGMVKKMYFPREILVLSYVITQFLNFVFGYIIVLIMLIVTGNATDPVLLLFVPLIMMIEFLFVTGMTLIVSAVCVYVRDIGIFISSASKLLFWGTPVIYTVDSITNGIRELIWYNPLTYYVETLHETLYYSTVPNGSEMLMCVMMAVIIMIAGMVLFNRLKRRFAEEL